jgi:cytochrome oxidase Cu insertion factor (SCO1/SenC/PrrC family)
LKRRALLAAAPAAALTAALAPARAEVDGARLPAPGSYALSRIMQAPDGMVLDSAARARRLHALLRGRLSVLSFVYSYCRDPEGCPLAWAALEGVQTALLQDPALASVSQIVSLSFDPSHDTPEQMRLIGGERITDARVRWHFLTTRSVAALLPLLDGFGQAVTVETDAHGRPTRTLNHMLKLFLIDAELQVREIYSVSTLSPTALLNDLRTLRLERSARS